tara:strand:+ start:1119 stop:1454 length:336 start_codon:yes stop_codon:yes gene_type:complete
MKAILIDVKNEEVKEVEHDDTLKNIYELVGCSTFDVVRIDNINGIYVDDEGLFVEDQLFFTYHGDTYSQTLAGNGLILGVDSEGNSIAPTITLEEVEEAIDFQQRGVDAWF